MIGNTNIKNKTYNLYRYPISASDICRCVVNATNEYTILNAESSTAKKIEYYNPISKPRWYIGYNANVSRVDHGVAGTSNYGIIAGGLSSRLDGGYDRIYTIEIFDNISAHITDASTMIARRGLACCGVVGAALIFGGDPGYVLSEKFNGYTCQLTSNMNRNRAWLTGCGKIDAGFAIGGRYNTTDSEGNTMHGYADTSEKFSGISWSLDDSIINKPRAFSASCGNISNALLFGGYAEESTDVGSSTERYNSSTWTTITGNAITARYRNSGCGNANNALTIGGAANGTPISSAILLNSEFFTNDNWSAGGNINVGRAGLSSSGSTSNAFSLCGSTDNTHTNGSTITERYSDSFCIYDSMYLSALTKEQNIKMSQGSSIAVSSLFKLSHDIPGEIVWYNAADNAISRTGLAGCGLSNSALAFGGYDTSGNYIGSTQLFNGITWSDASNMNILLTDLDGSGSVNAAISAGGKFKNSNDETDSTLTANTYMFNGSSWSGRGTLNNVRTYPTCCGSINATLVFGGDQSDVGGSCISSIEKFNGISWSIFADLPIACCHSSAVGNSNTALISGGTYNYNIVSNVYSFNGDTCSIASTNNTIRYAASGVGIVNSNILFGGYADGGIITTTTELFNGVIWSAMNNMVTGRICMGQSGNANSALSFAGQNPNIVNNTEISIKLTSVLETLNIENGECFDSDIIGYISSNKPITIGPIA